MDLFRTIVDLFLHLDKHLSQVISHYGARPEADLRALAGELLAA